MDVMMVALAEQVKIEIGEVGAHSQRLKGPA